MLKIDRYVVDRCIDVYLNNTMRTIVTPYFFAYDGFRHNTLCFRHDTMVIPCFLDNCHDNTVDVCTLIVCFSNYHGRFIWQYHVLLVFFLRMDHSNTMVFFVETYDGKTVFKTIVF